MVPDDTPKPTRERGWLDQGRQPVPRCDERLLDDVLRRPEVADQRQRIPERHVLGALRDLGKRVEVSRRCRSYQGLQVHRAPPPIGARIGDRALPSARTRATAPRPPRPAPPRRGPRPGRTTRSWFTLERNADPWSGTLPPRCCTPRLPRSRSATRRAGSAPGRASRSPALTRPRLVRDWGGSI